jgi:hypothetical protein
MTGLQSIDIPSLFSDNLGILTSGIPREIFWAYYVAVFLFFVINFVIISYHLNHYAIRVGSALLAKFVYAGFSIAGLIGMFIALLQI